MQTQINERADLAWVRRYKVLFDLKGKTGRDSHTAPPYRQARRYRRDALFLASRASANVTGYVLVADGGETIS